MKQGDELFSQRHGLTATGSLVYGEVPSTVRNVLQNVFTDLAKIEGWVQLYKNYCNRAGISYDMDLLDETEAYTHLTATVLSICQWWQVFDLIEDAHQTLKYKPPNPFSPAPSLQRNVNKVFQLHGIGYRMTGGRVERVGEPFLQARIDEAQQLLADTLFAGAADHFRKALSFINQRPNPDCENCVKEAVSAVEALARIICQKQTALLSKLLPELVKRGLIAKHLDGAIQKLYVYRGDAPGVAHGKTGSEVPIGEEEAEFVLGFCASTLSYLVKKHRVSKAKV